MKRPARMDALRPALTEAAAAAAEILGAVAAVDSAESGDALLRLASLAREVPTTHNAYGGLLTYRTHWVARQWRRDEYALNMARESALDALEDLLFARCEEVRGDPWRDRPARIHAYAEVARLWLAELSKRSGE